MRNLRHLLYSIAILISWTTLLWPQQYIFDVQHYGVEEGLSHRDVQSVHQDTRGIMWFGTKYGLNRFDGYNFKWYTKETHGLQSNVVNHIFEDDKGRLWLIDTDNYIFNGVRSIDIFNPNTETSTSFDTFATLPC